MDCPKPKLYYFDIYGRAECIRMAFWIAKQEFEDVRLNHEEFGKLKAEGFFFNGQVPMLQVGDKKLYQMASILRYVCQKNNLYPTNPEDIHRTEAVAAYRMDLYVKAAPHLQNKDEEAKKKGLDNYFENELPGLLKQLEKFYLENPWKSHYVAGNSLTYGDIVLVDMYQWLKGPFGAGRVQKALDSCPDLVKYLNTREADFKEYLEKRPKHDH